MEDFDKELVFRMLDVEPPIVVRPSIAKEIGLNEAIVLQQLVFWLNRSNNVRDGKRWVYKTYEQWAQEFPFWSIATVRRTIQSLRDRGLVETTDEYNRMKIDNTLWYTVPDYPMSRPSAQNEQTTYSDCADPSAQNEQANNHRLPKNTTESGPPPAHLGQRRKRQKPAHIITAEKFGLTPKEMTDFVNAILDVTQRRELADTDTELGERELSTAQTVAETLLQMGIHTPNDVQRIVQVFRSYHPDWDIMPSQLPQYATKDFKKAAPSYSEERRGVVNMTFRN